MPHFDKHGHLLPYVIQDVSLSEFKSAFVDELADREHRQVLFEQYSSFIESLKSTFGVPFVQWVDGSFVTTKELPNDLDVVTFLPYDLMTKKANAVRYYRENSKFMFNVDAGFCPRCKWIHRFFEEAKALETYWANLYGLSRKDNLGKRYSKGIVQLTFQP